MTPAAGSTQLPTRLGPYELGEVLGVGGAAVVVRARDDRLEADVAIKLLRVTDPEIAVRFLREGRLLRRVSHPSVIAVHDVGETPDGRPFLVMDLAQCSLSDRLRTATPPADAATLRAVCTALADGLGALHRVGVVHRDIKPANLLVLAEREAGTELLDGTILGPDERLVIGDLGFAKDQRLVNPGTTLLGGTPGFRPPEQVEYGRSIDARADVYAATGVLWTLVIGRTPPPPEQLPVELLAAPAVWRDVLSCGMAADPEDRFSDMANWAAAVFAVLDGEPDNVAAPRSVHVIAANTFPYKGLAAFQPEDAALFFGRAELIDTLVSRLAAIPTLVVGGASGSGKSSLVRAGLIPRLEAGALPGSADRRSCLLTPGDRPLRALREQLLAAGATSLSEEAMRGDPGAAAAALPNPVLLVVDQFEELFTLAGDGDETDAFLAVLDALTRGAVPRARLVLAIRADFYARAAAHPWLAAAVNANQVLVGPMTRAELRQAIEGPARRVGLHLQDGLADRMLADTGDDPGALPLLAHALAETWLRRDGDVLTIAGYEAAGGVAGALQRSADEVWEQIDPSDRPTARRLLLRLVQPGDGTPDTKRLLAWSALGEAHQGLVARFAEARLVTLDAAGVQFAHEALLRSWPRLLSWLVEDREALRVGRRIEESATEWERQGRHPDLLAHGLPLQAALDWQGGQDGDISWTVAAYLTASGAAEDAAVVAERDRAARATRIRRRVLSGLIALTTLAVVASILAGVGLARSRHDAGSARRANAAAAVQLSQALAASAKNLAETDPYQAVALAGRALAGRGAPGAARDALVRARLALAGDRLVPLGEPVATPSGFAVAIAPAADLVAVGDRDGSVGLWRLPGGAPVATLTGPKSGVQSVAFTADGHVLVAGDADGTLWTWVIPSIAGRAPEPAGRAIVSTGSVIWAVATAPTGTTVAATTASGRLYLVDAESGAALGEPFDAGVGDLMSVAFADDGQTVLVGAGDGHVVAREPATNTVRWTIPAHTSRVLDLMVCQKCAPASFVTVSSDGTARLWDLATGATLPGPFDGPAPQIPTGVRGASFSPDGSTLTLGAIDGSLYTWSLTGHRVDRAQGHRDHVIGLGTSADGLTVVSLSNDQTFRTWSRAPRPAAAARIADLGVAATAMTLAPNENALALGLADGTVRLLNPANGQELSRLAVGGGAVGAVAFLGADRVVTGDDSGALRLWDVASGARVGGQDTAHAGAITSIAVAGSGNDRRLVTAGSDGWLRLWPADLHAPTAQLDTHAALTDVAADGPDTIVAVGRTGEVIRWNPSAGSIERIASIGDTAWAVALDERSAAVARADEVVSMWTLGERGGATLRWQQGAQTGGALDVAYLGVDALAIGSGDGALRFADALTGTPIGPPLALGTAQIRHVVAGPDNTVWAVDRTGAVYRCDALVLPRG